MKQSYVISVDGFYNEYTRTLTHSLTASISTGLLYLTSTQHTRTHSLTYEFINTRTNNAQSLTLSIQDAAHAKVDNREQTVSHFINC